MANGKSKAPAQTFEEPKYLRALIEARTPVRVVTVSNDEYDGVVEYFDASFLRLTREGHPNLFLFKHDIKYVIEDPDAG